MGWLNSTTTVVNKPPELTPEQQQQQQLMLQEMQRQNDLAAAMLPNQQALIEQQRALIQYQLDHQGDLDELHNQQLKLAGLQIQSEINNQAMQQELQPQQLEYLKNSNALAAQQIEQLRKVGLFQDEQNKYILEQLRDQSARIAARNKYYSPEEEAQAAAEEARRAARMGALSEEAAQIQLENLKRGTKPTEEQLANINEAYDAVQARGESDISKYLQDTLRIINEETAQAAGLRSTDTPVVRLSERAGEEAARAQGNLTETVAQGRATARLNYPLAASKLAGDQASTLQSLAAGAADFQSSLRAAAAANRAQAFALPSSVGFAMPQSGGGTNVGFMSPVAQAGYNPSAFNMNFAQFNTNPSSSTSTHSPGFTEFLSPFGGFASGVGRLVQSWPR